MMWRFVAVGVAAGFMSGMFGVGGGIVMVPLLVLVAKLDQRQASATSLAAIIPTALAGAIGYGLHGNLALWPAVAVAAGGIGGSMAGTALLHRLPLRGLTWGFVGMQAVVAVTMVFFEPTRAADVATGGWTWPALFGLGLLMGLCAGLFGVGGGVIVVPALMGLFGAGDLVARGTSLLVMVPSAITGTVSNAKARLVSLTPALVVGLAATAASYGGTAAASAIPPRAGNLAFAGLLVVSIVQLTRKNLKRSR